MVDKKKTTSFLLLYIAGLLSIVASIPIFGFLIFKLELLGGIAYFLFVFPNVVSLGFIILRKKLNLVHLKAQDLVILFIFGYVSMGIIFMIASYMTDSMSMEEYMTNSGFILLLVALSFPVLQAFWVYKKSQVQTK